MSLRRVSFSSARGVAGLLGLCAVLLAVSPAFAYRELAQWAGHRFSALGSAFDGAGDINGDGFDDVVVGISTDGFGSSTGEAWLGLGSKTGALRVIVIHGRPGQNLGYPVSGAGDVDGDGFADVVIGDGNGLHLYRGGASPDTSADLDFFTVGTHPRLVVRGIGDWNADGYDDIAVATPTSARVTIYFGGAQPDSVPDRVLLGESAFGTSIAGGRDLNGDGIDDLAVGSPNADGPGSSDAGEVRVYFGGANPDTTVDTVLQGPIAGARLGVSLDLLGDFDGDGSSDVVAGAPNTPGGRVFVFRGGAALDANPDWSVGGSGFMYAGYATFGGSVAAGDDVNRDHVSDVIVGGFNNDEWLIYFGGASADTTPDIFYPSPTYFPAAGSVMPAGDVDGNGYQDWFGGRGSGGGMGNFTALTLFTLHGVRPAPLPEFVSGVPATVSWYGEDRVDLSFTEDGQTWQVIAPGVGGAGHQNSTTITLPATRTGRLRWSVVDVDSIDVESPVFVVHDSLELRCASAVVLPTGIAVTWSVGWYGYPSTPQRYHLYRQDGGTETQLGGDTLTSSNLFDTNGSVSSTYRLAAVFPDEQERGLGTFPVGAGSCDSVHLVLPVAGETWNIPGSYGYVTWSGTRQVDLALSLDDGLTWQIASESLPPFGDLAIMSLVLVRPTEHARVRASIHDAPWVTDEVSFRIVGITANDFDATAETSGGVSLVWSLSEIPTYPAWVMRVDPGNVLVPVTAVDANHSFDPDGVVGSQYRLYVADVINSYPSLIAAAVADTVPAGPIPPNPIPRQAAILPSLAHRETQVTVAIPEVRSSQGSQVTDVEVRVYDSSGRQVARIADHRGGQAGTLQWIPAAYGLRSGVYWVRVRSGQGDYKASLRFIVLD